MEKKIINKKDLIEFIESGCKPKNDWKIGTEHEKFGFFKKDLNLFDLCNADVIIKERSDPDNTNFIPILIYSDISSSLYTPPIPGVLPYFLHA